MTTRKIEVMTNRFHVLKLHKLGKIELVHSISKSPKKVSFGI